MTTYNGRILEAPQEEFEDIIDGLVSEFVDRKAPGVALLIGHGEKVRLARGYGLADVDRGTPITPQTRFIIASVTKQFVCTAVMMLEQRGLLDYDEPVARFFPDFPGWCHRVTLRHLMTHTSGVHEYLTDTFWKECITREFDQGQVLDRISGYTTLDFEPGSAYRYSNSGYIMLGAVIEQASGQPLKQFMRDNIFAPLGMKNTEVGDSGERLPGGAVGYKYHSAEDFEEAPYNRSIVGWADGNIISTVEDMFLWHRALYTDRLLPGWVLGQAFTPVNGVDPAFSRYGFGWNNNRRRGLRELWHAGGTLGFTTRFARFVDEDICVVLFSNGDGLNLAELHGAISEALLGKKMTPIEPLSLDTDSARAALSEKAGTYVDVLGETIGSNRIAPVTIRYNPGSISLSIEGATRIPDATELVPIREHVFRVDNRSDHYVEFLENANGQTTGLRINANGSVTNLQRRDETQ